MEPHRREASRREMTVQRLQHVGAVERRADLGREDKTLRRLPGLRAMF
jgi:hypothetical protein